MKKGKANMLSGALSRKGRPRLLRLREPSGRVSRAGNHDAPPAAVKRLRDAALRSMADPEWGTSLGRLFLLGVIDETEYAAGKQWGRTIAAWHQATECPPPSPKSASVIFAGRAAKPDPDSERGRQLHQQAEKAVLQMQEAHAALMAAGNGAERLVRRLVEEDIAPIGPAEQEQVIKGLLWLAAHWGLTSSANNPKRQK